jgi:MraZ protein
MRCFLAYIETTWGTALFVTSDSGQMVQIYPLPVWMEIQTKLAAMPSSHPTRRKFALWTNYYGKVAELDAQGRVLIHPLLRDTAAMNGEVVVLGDINRLSLWNHDRFKQLEPEQRLTDDDWKALSEHGI